MLLSEALTEISNIYPPGCVSFYSKMDPDPWQKIHDDLEHQVVTDATEEGISIAAEMFAKRARGLIKRFLQEAGSAQFEITPADSFHMSPERVKRAQSTKFKHCLMCETTEDLLIGRDPKDPSDIWLVCRSCNSIEN